MKLLVAIMLVSITFPLSAFAQDAATETPVVGANLTSDVKLPTEADRISYMLGKDVGDTLAKYPIAIDLDLVLRAIRDSVEGKSAPLTYGELQETRLAWQRQMQDAQDQMADEEGLVNMEAGRAYLEENAKKDGVKVLDGNVQYRVLTAGDGASPAEEDSVRVHYEGRFLDGRIFDSTYQVGQPLTMRMTIPIKGLQVALKQMKTGDKWEVVVPSDMAFGAAPQAGIPPNSTLVYELELLEVIPPGKE